MSNTENTKPIFPKGDRTSSNYFTGSAWVKNLVPGDDVLKTVIGNVVFEPGARNNWHRHGGGQILIVTDGLGYYQEKGKPAQLLRPGDVVQVPPALVHWHGAGPAQSFTHIAINPNMQDGVVEWLEPVTEKEYMEAVGG
jgi:quercetin dioxygenase-like cupin family protein